MAFWNELSNQKKLILIGFGGGVNSHNDPLIIDNDELTDCENMCSDDHPVIRTRNDRTLTSLPNSTTPIHGIGHRNYDTIHALIGGVWQYGATTDAAWTAVNSTIDRTNTAKFVEFNTQTDRYTVCAIDRSTGDTVYNTAWSSNAGVLEVSLTSDSPQTALYTPHRYRLYAMGNDKRTLYYSAQGDLTDWVTADDAGYIDITELKGPAMAITTYNDHVIIWSETSMHELYGTYSENFELVNISNRVGCVALNAHAECDEKLYWLDYNGVYMYTGGLPRKVAHNAKKYIEGINWSYKHLIQAGSINSKLYFAIPYQDTKINKVIVIDTRHVDQYGNTMYVVTVEDGNWAGFTNNNENMYGICSSGDIYNMSSTEKLGYDAGTSANMISWYLETRPITAEDINTISAVEDIWLEHQGTTNVTMEVGFTTNSNSTDFTSFSTSFTHSTHAVRTRMLPTSTQLDGMGFMKFRIEGTGHKKLSAMQINLLSYGEMA